MANTIVWAIPVADLDRAVKFYGDVPQTPTIGSLGCFLDPQGDRIGVHEPPERIG